MKLLGNLPHPKIRISLFAWNGKYLVKFESKNLEQIFKIPEYDLSSENELQKVLNDRFLEKIESRFLEMEKDFNTLWEV